MTSYQQEYILTIFIKSVSLMKLIKCRLIKSISCGLFILGQAYFMAQIGFLLAKLSNAKIIEGLSRLG